MHLAIWICLEKQPSTAAQDVSKEAFALIVAFLSFPDWLLKIYVFTIH